MIIMDHDKEIIEFCGVWWHNFKHKIDKGYMCDKHDLETRKKAWYGLKAFDEHSKYAWVLKYW